LEPQKRIINEPSWLIREAARKAMRGRMPLLIASSIIYILCMSVPIIIVEEITGLWENLERATEDYMAVLANPTFEAVNEWAQAWSPKINISTASFFYVLLVPGPLTLGLSVIWLRVLRGKDAYADMVFSGFGNFLRALFLHVIRGVFIMLWSILLLVPGVIAYYRFSLAFFLLADNPGMGPIAGLSYSKYYMQQNKGSRFVLDFSFIGWFALSALVFFAVDGGILALMQSTGYAPSFFAQELISGILGAFVFAPLYAYRGVASAEYYHRVICREPGSFPELPETT